jgi:hypothetical protein
MFSALMLTPALNAACVNSLMNLPIFSELILFQRLPASIHSLVGRAPKPNKKNEQATSHNALERPC